VRSFSGNSGQKRAILFFNKQRLTKMDIDINPSTEMIDYATIPPSKFTIGKIFTSDLQGVINLSHRTKSTLSFVARSSVQQHFINHPALVKRDCKKQNHRGRNLLRGE
jgi:hypothetical protein